MIDLEYLDTLYKWKHEAEEALDSFDNRTDEHLPEDSENSMMLKAARREFHKKERDFLEKKVNHCTNNIRVYLSLCVQGNIK